MSKTSIKLSDPQNFPFGQLSNHSYYPMIIDDEKYDNVTKYVYSNMLTTPTFKNVIKYMNMNVKR